MCCGARAKLQWTAGYLCGFALLNPLASQFISITDPEAIIGSEPQKKVVGHRVDLPERSEDKDAFPVVQPQWTGVDAKWEATAGHPNARDNRRDDAAQSFRPVAGTEDFACRRDAEYALVWFAHQCFTTPLQALRPNEQAEEGASYQS